MKFIEQNSIEICRDTIDEIYRDTIATYLYMYLNFISAVSLVLKYL